MQVKDSDDDVIEDEDTATDVDDADTGHNDVMSTFGQHDMIRIYNTRHHHRRPRTS